MHAWRQIMLQVGHFQLLDEQSLLQSSACSSGKVDEVAVRKLCQDLMQSWFLAEGHARPALIRRACFGSELDTQIFDGSDLG